MAKAGNLKLNFVSKSIGIHVFEFEDIFRCYRDNENLKQHFGRVDTLNDIMYRFSQAYKRSSWAGVVKSEIKLTQDNQEFEFEFGTFTVRFSIDVVSFLILSYLNVIKYRNQNQRKTFLSKKKIILQLTFKLLGLLLPFPNTLALYTSTNTHEKNSRLLIG